MNSLGWLETFWQDVRYGLRQLNRNPGFSAVVVITLALGIGANSAVFSVLNGLFLRVLPVPHPERVVTFSDDSHSWPDYLAYRDQAKSFESLSTSFGLLFTANLNSSHPPQHVYGSLVTGNFLTTLGVKPALGRGFLPDEDQLGSPKPVVILSYKMWRSQLGGDPAILGKSIRLNSATYTVVGVMPSEIRTVDFGMTPDLWAPIATWQQWKPVEESRGNPFNDPNWTSFGIFGRLRAGVALRAAQAELNVISDRLRKAAGKKERQPIALTPAGIMPGELGQFFLGISVVVSVIAGLVLLIACVNIANLLLARGTSRRREIAIRLAVGASRGRVIRQLMIGNLILALLGGAAGLPLAWAAAEAAARVDLPLTMPITFNFSPDLRVVLVTAAIAVVTSLLFGLAPAVRATRQDVNALLKDGDATSTGSATRWTRNVLVMIQVAVSVVVLVAAALFLHSLWNGFSTNLGFRPQNLLIVRVDTAAQGYSQERSARFFEQLEEQVGKLPGVHAASVVAPLPLSFVGSGRDFSVSGTSRTINAQLRIVGRRYFETMGIPLLKGRDFRDIEVTATPVAVISRAMADRAFPNENPVGRRIGWQHEQNKQAYEIVGVVGDTKSKTIG
jgi:predicted permease